MTLPCEGAGDRLRWRGPFIIWVPVSESEDVAHQTGVFIARISGLMMELWIWVKPLSPLRGPPSPHGDGKDSLSVKRQTSNSKLQTTNYKLSFPALPARASSRDRAWAGESPNSPLFPSGTGCQFWGCQCQYYIYTNVDTLFDTLFLLPIRIAFFFLFIL